MKIEFQTIHLPKRFPLGISRGVFTGSDNLFVTLTRDGITGIGEMSPGDTEGADTPEAGQLALETFLEQGLEDRSVSEVYDLAVAQNVPPCALAALDIALWDWLSKKAGLPLYQMLGLGRPKVVTSVTVGINSPEVVRERVPLLLNGTGVRSLKIKLGSPEGLDADKAMFAAVAEAAEGYDATLRVDANGGWDLDQARTMMKWLADRGVEYIEQPLKLGQEDLLPSLFKDRALPIFVDESCRISSDIPNWAHAVDGVNLKLMKCGGIAKAIEILRLCRAQGITCMLGSMLEGPVSIAAAMHLAMAYRDTIGFLDLDSPLLYGKTERTLPVSFRANRLYLSNSTGI